MNMRIRLPRKAKKAWKQCQATYPNIRYNTRWKRRVKRYAKGIMRIPEEWVRDSDMLRWIDYAKSASILLYREKDKNPFTNQVIHFKPKAHYFIEQYLHNKRALGKSEVKPMRFKETPPVAHLEEIAFFDVEPCKESREI